MTHLLLYNKYDTLYIIKQNLNAMFGIICNYPRTWWCRL